MKILVAIVLSVLPGLALAQQHPNLEVQPDRSGGYTGTYGHRNFEIYRQPKWQDGVEGQIGGERFGTQGRSGSGAGNSFGNCYADGYGNAVCTQKGD